MTWAVTTRVSPDERDLNYASYFTEGEAQVSFLHDYNSHNTRRLDVDGMIDLLLKLECVQRAVQGEANRSVTERESMPNILVTGAQGFVGRNLCVGLRRQEAVVLSEYDLDNSPEELRRR